MKYFWTCYHSSNFHCHGLNPVRVQGCGPKGLSALKTSRENFNDLGSVFKRDKFWKAGNFHYKQCFNLIIRSQNDVSDYNFYESVPERPFYVSLAFKEQSLISFHFTE